MLEKSKGPEVKNIKKRHGLGIVGYGDSLFPIPGLDGLGHHDGADEIELQSLNQILHRVTPNSNVMTTYPSGTITSSFGQSLTDGKSLDVKVVATLTQLLQLWVSKGGFDSHVGLVQQVMQDVCSFLVKMLVGNSSDSSSLISISLSS
ncbi:hypothetical protein Tco_0265310 [Tanacetum coccineum]